MMYVIKRTIGIDADGSLLCIFYHSLTPTGVPLWVEHRQDAQRLSRDDGDTLVEFLRRSYAEAVVLE